MDYLQQFFHMILHIDQYLNAFVSAYGFWTYLLLFTVIFCETGLVVAPFLPGDSLLFAAGSIAAQPESALEIMVLIGLLFVASVLGNQVNYFIGSTIGQGLISNKKCKVIKAEHLQETHAFYAKHGGKTLILARFLPIIRTFAPFVAGLGRMELPRFTAYNLVSAILWTGSLLSLGYFLGSIPLIRQNFTWVIYGIILVSFLPTLTSLYYKLRKSRGNML